MSWQQRKNTYTKQCCHQSPFNLFSVLDSSLLNNANYHFPIRTRHSRPLILLNIHPLNRPVSVELPAIYHHQFSDRTIRKTVLTYSRDLTIFNAPILPGMIPQNTKRIFLQISFTKSSDLPNIIKIYSGVIVCKMLCEIRERQTTRVTVDQTNL